MYVNVATIELYTARKVFREPMKCKKKSPRFPHWLELRRPLRNCQLSGSKQCGH